VFTSALGREEKQLLVGLMQPKARSWRHLHIYPSRSACTPGAQSQARGSYCPAAATRAQSPSLKTIPHSANDRISCEKG